MGASLADLEAMIAEDDTVRETPVAPPIITASLENLDEMIAEDESGFPGAGIVEPALTVATGLAGTLAGGIAGTAQALNPFADEGAADRAVRGTQEAFTVLPKSEEGKAGLKTLGDFIESEIQGFNDRSSIAAGGLDMMMRGNPSQAGETISQTSDVLDKGVGAVAGDFVFDITGSPGLATTAYTSPDILMTALGLSSLRGVRTGTQLLDEAGNPTKELTAALDRHGIVFENLTDEAKAAIPEYASPKLLPSPKSETLNAAEETAKAQLKSGGRDDSLATLRLENDTLKTDKLGEEAIKQGFKPGFVQAVKTANAETKDVMLKMLKKMQRIQGNSRLALDFRPSDHIGEALVKRITFIRDKADSARLELNHIAETQLRGKPLDPRPVEDQFRKTLADLDVTLVDGPRGIPKAEYKGSMISKDKTSQKIINDAIDLLSEGGTPDALRFHKLKRQLDTMIDFRKKSKDGLTDAGRNVLKDLRKSLNTALRTSNTRYAEVNDTLSQSLDAFESMQKAVGPSIDIFGYSSRASLGQDMRGLMSNRKTRVKLDDAVNQMDDTARNLGGGFKEDIKDLALFAHSLDNRFGAVAESGIKAEITAGVETAIKQGPTAAVMDYGTGKLVGGLEKLRGINDLKAFQSIEDILKR